VANIKWFASATRKRDFATFRLISLCSFPPANDRGGLVAFITTWERRACISPVSHQAGRERLSKSIPQRWMGSLLPAERAKSLSAFVARVVQLAAQLFFRRQFGHGVGGLGGLKLGGLGGAQLVEGHGAYDAPAPTVSAAV
jgi:hypothetical protein